MNYTRSILSVPYPKSYYDLGAQGIVEWEMAAEGNPINEVFLEQLKSKGANNKKLFSTIDKSGSFFNKNPFLSPDLFIFHSSRCGSSYASNYFATNPENRVLYEPNLLIQYVKNHWENEIDNPLKLKSIIQLLGCGALPKQKRLIIKLTSNSIRKLDEIHALYPTTPKLFIYRDPKEILISLLDGPPAYLPGKKEGEEKLLKAAIENLELAFEIALENKSKFHAFINYSNLKKGISKLENVFSWGNNNADRLEQLEIIENRNSKNSKIPFKPDSQEKQVKWKEISYQYEFLIKKLENQYKEITKLS